MAPPSVVLQVATVAEWTTPPQTLPPPRWPDMLFADTSLGRIERAAQTVVALADKCINALHPRCTVRNAFIRFWERNQAPWLVAGSPDATQLAVASELALEVYRAASTEAATLELVASTIEPRPAAFPQWRRLRWSSDGQFIVLLSTTCSIRIYTPNLELLATIPSPFSEYDGPPPISLFSRYAYAHVPLCAVDCCLRPAAGERPPVLHILAYNGQLVTLALAQLQAGGGLAAAAAAAAPASTSATSLASSGFETVGAMVLVEAQGLLVVAGTGAGKRDLLLSIYRTTNDDVLPCLAPVEGACPKHVDLPEPLSENDSVLRLAVAPDAAHMAVLTQLGWLVVLRLPSLAVVTSRNVSGLPAFRTMAAEAAIYDAENALEDAVFDVSWWDASSLVLSHCGGNVALVDCQSLEPAVFSTEAVLPLHGRAPQLACSSDGLAHSTESDAGDTTEADSSGSTATTLPRLHSLQSAQRAASTSTTTRGQRQEDDAPAGAFATILSKTIANRLLQLARFLTRSRHLTLASPTRLQYHHVLRRVVAMNASTALAQRIQQRDFAGALELAQQHDLSPDPIYQAQWRLEPVSQFTVRDFLVRVADKDWVLNEILHTPPNDLATAQAMYHHALAVTALHRIWPEATGDGSGSSVEESALSASMLANLTAAQGRLLAARINVLHLRDHLLTYERGLADPEDFEAQAAWRAMHTPLLASAVDAALNGKIEILELLLARHQVVLRPYYLTLLALLPEAVSLGELRRLLPRCNGDGTVALIASKPWQAQADWAVADPAVASAPAVAPHVLSVAQADLDAERGRLPLPEDVRQLLQQGSGDALWPDAVVAEPTAALVTDWVVARAQRLTAIGAVTAAFNFAALMASQGVPLSDTLLAELKLLGTLTYECEGTTDVGILTLRELQTNAGPEEVLLRLVGPAAAPEAATTLLRQRVLPYLRSAVHADRQTNKTEAAANVVERLVSGNAAALLAVMADPDVWSLLVPDAQRQAHLILAAAYAPTTAPAHVRKLAEEAATLLEQNVQGLNTDTQQHLRTLQQHASTLRLLAALGVPKSLDVIRENDSRRMTELEARAAVDTILRAQLRRPQRDWEETWALLNELRTAWLPELSEVGLAQAFVQTVLLVPDAQARRVCLALLPFSEESSSSVTETTAAAAKSSAGSMSQGALGRSLSDSLTRLVSGGRGTSGQPQQQQPTEPQVTTPQLDLGFQLPEPEAIQAVLAAVQELINSASSLTDPAMTTATDLLALLPADAALAERNFMQGLQRLSQLGVEVQPLQLKLAQNKAGLFVQLVNQDRVAAQADTFLVSSLSELGLTPNDVAHVVTALAKKGLKNRDFERALRWCTWLADKKRGDAWQICAEVAMLGLADKRPTEMQQRGCIKLLSFALCSCTPDNLPELLALVDIEVLAQNKLAPLTQKVASDGSSGLLARALLGATSNANSISVTASLSAPTLWAGGAEHSLPLLSLEVESATVDDIKKAAASLSAVTAKLQDAPSNATARAEMSRLCVELARRSARSDAPFAIALMLSCPDAALATETLKTLTAPTNPTALVVVVYVAAMALYGQELAVWTQPPHVLIDRARNHSRGEAPLQQQPWLDVIDWAETQLAQLARAQSILATFPQADIGRFEVDETYREQCFVDALLARSDAAAVEKLWTLARELNVDAWRVSWAWFQRCGKPALTEANKLQPLVKHSKRTLETIAMTSADAGATFETIEAQLLLAEKLAAEPSELEAQPFWLQRPSATLKLLRLLASHHALPSPISAAFEGMISLQQWLASRRWPLDSIDAAATMLADTVGDATAGSALRRQLLLAHATQLPLASEADVATADSAWLHEWRLLLAVLAGCLPVDMAAFASVTLSGTAGVRMQPRPVRAKMLQTLEAVLKTKSSSEPGFAEAKAQLDQLKEELQQLEADACAQALEAVGGKWTSLYSTARGQSDQLEALAIELLASMGAASGTSLSSGATWRAARMVAGQGGASSWSDVVATVASTAAARLLGSKAEAAAGELTSNRGTPRLRTAAAQSTSILSDEDCIRALEAFLMQAAAAAAAEPTDETNAAVKTGLTQLLSDFAAVGERHCVCWSKTALALLRLGQAWQADVGSALAAAVRLEALRQIWSESGDDVAALDQHLAGSEHTFAALWQAACGAVSQADDVASLLSRWQQWRERLQDATEELGRTALLDACAATALRRALELDADGALAALCCNALALGVGPEMLLAVAAEAEAKGRPAWVRAALLLAGRTDGRWTEALKSDAVVPDSLGLAALTYLVCQQKQLGALGASTPAVLALVLDACVEIEGGVNMALAPTGLRLKLEPEEICAQLDAVTAGSWLLRVRGTGRGQRTLGAAVAAAAGLKSGR